ncbi:hypothetical protein K4K60_012167 [Colletotrichum sp. SAR11_57]|nr:hypothetical protein K4K60_012167 [Colletotrichum sp. SAR11_57]
MPCGPPDGEIVTIKAEHKLDLPDQDILMLQFLLITGWAMAAGREPKHFNFDIDYDTDRFWEARRKSAKSYFETLEDKTSTMEDIYELLQSFHKAHDLYESLNGDEKKKRCDPNAALNRDDGRVHNKVQSRNNILGTTRNVLSLNTQMRQYWANGRFSLEPWGEPYQETTERRRTGTGGLWCQEVRFHWMRQTKINMQEKWDGRGQSLRDLLPPHLGRYDHWSVKTGRLIQGGEVIAIKAKNRLDLPDRDFLDIQHRLISAWSMAAGVEPKNFTFEDEGPKQPRG